MRKLQLIFCILLFSVNVSAQPSQPGFIELTEEDGAPACYGYSIKAANGAVTDNGDGTCSLAGGSGGTECASASCDLNVSTTLNTQGICLADGTNCPAAGSGDITDVFSCASGDCASITMAATDLLNMSGTDASTTTEGLILPQHATACAGGTAEGQVCWEADANILHIGDGATIVDFVPTSAVSGEATMSTTGAVTLADSVTVTGWTMGTFSATQLTSPTVLIDLLDGVGAVDMDYGSADITDHTFTTDNGTAVVLDGTASVIGANEIVDKGDTASTTAAGIVELASAAEMDTATDTGRALGVNEFNDSDWGVREIQVIILDDTTDLTVKDGIGDFEFTVPTTLDGYNIVDVECGVYVAGTTGTQTFQIHNVTSAADILSTKCTVDTTELNSFTAAAAPVISGTEDDLTAGDRIRFDSDVIQTTAAKGAWFNLTVRKP